MNYYLIDDFMTVYADSPVDAVTKCLLTGTHDVKLHPLFHKPHDSTTNREGQGGEPPAKCIMIPADFPCIGCGECKN